MIRTMRAQRRFPILLTLLLLLGGLAAAGYAWLFGGMPDTAVTPAHLQAPSVRINDRAGRLVYESFPAEGGRHQSLPLAQIPKALIQATIATEDSQFLT